MSWSAVKLRDVRSSIKKDTSVKKCRSASLDNRSRGSYVPENARSSSDERKSGKFFNSWGTGARKSSLNLSEAKRKDTRPLADKAYQRKKVAELAKYLEEGFDFQIDTLKLMCPSKKDFENIFEILYKYFDPTYQVKKIEDEAPKILKLLNYPFNVNKSAFVYVARTNWPSLLGVILWLMDLTKFSTKSKASLKSLFEVDEDVEEGNHTSKIFFRYICDCHSSGFDDEEQMNEVFHKIIKSSMCNLDELIETNEKKRLLLDSVNKEIEDRNELAKTKTVLDTSIQKYEDYILRMKSHYEKRKEAMEPLLEEKKKKESILKALLDEKRKKQDLYDAQGFDGKKRLKYFEMQKKELNEELEKKQNLRRELQDKYELSEMEYRKKFDKITSSAADLKKTYDSITEDAKVLLKPLCNIKDPQLQKLCSYYCVEFPDFFIPADTESRKTFKSALEDVGEKIQIMRDYLQRILFAWNQRNNEIEMQNSELSARLKLLSVQENVKEKDLDTIKKQNVDEISSLEVQSEEKYLHIKNLQDEVTKFKLTVEEMLEELNSLEHFRNKKSKQLKDYLVEQEEMFQYYDRKEKELAEECEAHGKEIAETIEKELKSMQKKR